jgi:hypothetical protein
MKTEDDDDDDIKIKFQIFLEDTKSTTLDDYNCEKDDELQDEITKTT